MVDIEQTLWTCHHEIQTPNHSLRPIHAFQRGLMLSILRRPPRSSWTQNWDHETEFRRNSQGKCLILAAAMKMLQKIGGGGGRPGPQRKGKFYWCRPFGGENNDKSFGGNSRQTTLHQGPESGTARTEMLPYHSIELLAGIGIEWKKNSASHYA